MVAKVAQNRTPRAVSNPAARPAAKKAASFGAGPAQKTWQPSGVRKPQLGGGLKVSKAAIDDGPSTTPRLTLPKGYTQVDGAVTHSESMPLADGRTAKLDINWATLGIKGPNGKSVELLPIKKSDLTDQVSWFQDEFKGKSKADLEFASFPEWNDDRSFAGVGGAGNMVSVMESGESYTGGAHPNHGSAITTFDARTGKEVKLDELLPKATVDKLAASIHARLQTLGGPDGVEGTTFSGGGDVASVRDTINSSFALVKDKNGKLNIDIAWESGVHALGGLMAHFTVPAPDDAAFKAKVGLE